MSRRTRPSRPPSKIVPALLGLAIVIVGFATLMMRLEVTQEGYRLSVLKQQAHTLEDEDRRLGIEAAELASHQGAFRTGRDKARDGRAGRRTTTKFARPQ